MELSALHSAIRSRVRQGAGPLPTASAQLVGLAEARLSAAERAALRAWRRHLRRAEGDIEQLTPEAGAAEWWRTPPQR